MILYPIVPYNDFKPFIMKYILKCWQDIWDQQIHNKLHKIHSIIGKTPCSYGHNWKGPVVLTRCRIDHGRLTHSYLLNNEELPECIPCNSNYSLKHVLIDWVDVAGDTILKFLKEIILYTKIYMCSYITYVFNIWFYPFNISFICIYNPFIL